MTTKWYRPFTQFKGLVGSNQENIFDILTPFSSSIFPSNNSRKDYSPSQAFNFSSSESATQPDERWISFSLTNSYFFITHYEIQQRTSISHNLMYKWSFFGSNDNETWTKLDTTKADSDFRQPGKSKLITCNHKGPFKHFKLQEESEWILVVQQIDIYGFWCDSKEHCRLSWIYQKTNNILLKLFSSPLVFFISTFFS